MALEYFTEPDLRTLPQMSDTTLYPLARVDAVAAFVVSRIEGFVGAAFVERPATEQHDTGSTIVLARPFARSVTSLTVNGIAVDTDALLLRSGVVRYRDGRGFSAAEAGGVEVTYVHGYSDIPPGDVKEVALQWTRLRLLATNSNAEMNARQTQVTNDMGGTTTFSVAGRDRPSGYPEVDAVLIDWRDKLDVFGFA